LGRKPEELHAVLLILKIPAAGLKTLFACEAGNKNNPGMVSMKQLGLSGNEWLPGFSTVIRLKTVLPIKKYIRSTANI